ncbi:unnamed protein product [Linum tenue]|uniref:Uncharacterized protein n=1 Tax=Linum tenue TaxID=586396 RepID=A0AAV0N6V6_9ROSI|nr:unnamed protein product [Linum tenue]
MSTEEAPSLCWDATPSEFSGSLVGRFISKRTPIMLQPETRSLSAISTSFTID